MSAIYPKFKEGLLADNFAALSGANIKIALLSSTYVYSAAHEFLSSVTGIVATSPILTAITITNGTLDAANTTITSVTGAVITQAVAYVDTGVAGTSRLIVHIDGLNLTPDGGNVDVTVNNLVIL